jgi:hypothetical protein
MYLPSAKTNTKHAHDKVCTLSILPLRPHNKVQYLFPKRKVSKSHSGLILDSKEQAIKRAKMGLIELHNEISLLTSVIGLVLILLSIR